MKLLFDQNLSHRLVAALQQEYLGSEHVRTIGLKDVADIAIWECMPPNMRLPLSQEMQTLISAAESEMVQDGR